MSYVPIHVRKPADIPSGEHYAILKFSTVPTSTYEANDGEATVITYEAYGSRQAWLDEIEHLEATRHCAYKAVFIKPAKVAAKIVVDVGGPDL